MVVAALVVEVVVVAALVVEVEADVVADLVVDVPPDGILESSRREFLTRISLLILYYTETRMAGRKEDNK